MNTGPNDSSTPPTDYTFSPSDVSTLTDAVSDTELTETDVEAMINQTSTADDDRKRRILIRKYLLAIEAL